MDEIEDHYARQNESDRNIDLNLLEGVMCTYKGNYEKGREALLGTKEGTRDSIGT